MQHLRPPTHPSWPTIEVSEVQEAEWEDYEGVERDELPTLVFHRESSLPPPMPSERHELSVIFHDVHRPAPRHATIPPPPLMPSATAPSNLPPAPAVPTPQPVNGGADGQAAPVRALLPMAEKPKQPLLPPMPTAAPAAHSAPPPAPAATSVPPPPAYPQQRSVPPPPQASPSVSPGAMGSPRAASLGPSASPGSSTSQAPPAVHGQALALYQNGDSLRPVVYPSTTAVAVHGSSYSLPPPRQSSWKGRLLPLLAAFVVGSGGLAMGLAWWDGEQGELLIDVADQQCGAVNDVQVFVDNELRCTSAPCTVKVKSGGHVVRAESNGQSIGAAEAILVSGEGATLHKMQLGPSPKTGIEVRAAEPGHLFVDGKAEGALPRRVTGLTAGEHNVRVIDHHGQVVFQRQVVVDEEQMLMLDTALFTNSKPSSDAEQEQSSKTMARGSRPAETRQESPSSSESSSSSSSGSDDAESDHASSGSKQREETSPSSARRVARASSPSQAAELSTPADTEEQQAEPQATALGTLNLSAEPSAVVVLDGRPIGSTPRTVRVSPGTHSLVFVHPTQGRKKATVTVKTGQTRNLQARF